MRRLRALELGDVAAVELEVDGTREGALDVTHERDRDEDVLAAPDEERIGTEPLEPGPEALLAVGLVAVDVAGALVEGVAAGRRQVGAEELVDAGGRPAAIAAGDEPADDGLDEAAAASAGGSRGAAAAP